MKSTVLCLALAAGCGADAAVPDEPSPDGGPSGNADGRAAADISMTAPDMTFRTDGARPDANAMADVAPPPVGGPAPPCRFNLCESFETYDDGAKPDPAIWRSGAVAVDSARAARGKKALHIVGASTGGAEKYIRETKFIPSNGGAYGRMFLWVEKRPFNVPFLHVSYVEVSAGATGGGYDLRYGNHFAGGATKPLAWGLNIDPHTGSEGGMRDNEPFTEKTWHCVEWFLDPKANEARFWFDGREKTTLHWLNSRSTDPSYAFPDFKSIAVGVATYHPSDIPVEAWIDEVVIHSERVGCNP